MTQAKSKIVHLTSVHRPFDVRIFDKHCRTAVEAGYRVTLVATYDTDVEIDGVELKAIPKPRGRFSRMTRNAFLAFREAWKQSADLYVIHDAELLPWARLMTLLGKTVIYDMHENVPKDILSKSWIPSVLRRPLSSTMRVVERLLIGRMPVIFAESSYADDYAWVKQAVIARNFAKLSSFQNSAEATGSPSGPAVAYVGAVSRDRGSLVTLAALSELKRRGISVGWHCVGPISPPDHQVELESVACESELTNVSFYGYLPRAEAIEKIETCAIGLAVLRPEPNFVASFPTKMFEYMALGMPVVVSDFPLYRQVVKECECGVCVDPTDSVQLADAIQRLLEQPEFARECGQRGREAVQEIYNWDAEFQKLNRFFEQLLLPDRNRSTESN